MDVVYGIDVLASNDPYVETAEKALASVAVAGTPGAFLVDFFPIRECFSILCQPRPVLTLAYGS